VQVEEAHGEHHERLVELASRLERLENDVAPMLAAHMAANL
jgi:iron-sulfur cluster repair protein YtfE (RIC family)